MPERNYTILSTTSLPFDRIKNIPDSVDIRVIPFIEIFPRPDEKIKSQILHLTTEKTAVIFTSAHAVKIVTDSLNQKPDWKIYSIRNETRMAIEKWFGPDYPVQTAENAKTLSARIQEDAIKKAVFFCGDQRLDILPAFLKNNGIQLQEIIVYDTLLTPKRLENPPDAILFFSPSAVRSFFSMNELSLETAVFAMGTTTRAAIKEFTENEIFISPEADKAHVLQMALEWAGSHPTI